MNYALRMECIEIDRQYDIYQEHIQQSKVRCIKDDN